MLISKENMLIIDCSHYRTSNFIRRVWRYQRCNQNP